MQSPKNKKLQSGAEHRYPVYDNKRENDLRTSHRFLEIANRHTEMTPLLNEFVSEIKKITGCEAVGMRILDENGHIPYQAYIGFSQQFYDQESPLSIECDGCMCVNVVKGTTDPNLPTLTSGGSFHTNGTTRFLSTLSETEKEQTRNACNRFGYESVALIPIRLGDRILGLIHIADSRENMISPQAVASFEWVARQLALAVQRIKTEEKSKESQERLKRLGDTLPEGMVYRLVHRPDGSRSFTHASEGSRRLFQVSPEEIANDANVLYDMIAPEFLESEHIAEKESMENLKIFDFEMPMTLPNGDTRWIRWHSKPERLADGTLIWDGVCLDVSRRRQAEETLRNARDELEVKVQERTNDLSETNKDLRHEIEERMQAEKALQQSKYFSQTVLMSLRDHVAVLDRQGNILAVNDSWKQFARKNNCQNLARIGSGVNYFEVCRLSSNGGDDTACAALDGIRSVINGDRDRFEIEYPCDSPMEKRWFHMAVIPLKRQEGGVIVSHIDTTVRKTAELELRKAYSEIKRLKNQLEADQSYLREEIKLAHNHENIIGNGDRLKYVLFRAEQIAPTDTTVLILGETGTGKELIARAIHSASLRSERPLIKVDCASLPANLIESELFGHEKGAFTGADKRRVGRFELANGATLFLDEIGDLPPDLQPKLLRVLQDGEFERLGSSQTLSTDVRIIAATNRNLEEDVREKIFRIDLWYRLSVFTITIPPLRDRHEDIGLLVSYMIKNFERKHGKRIRSVPTDTLAKLQNYSWPGNVRELENVIQRAVINSKGDRLQLADDLTTSRSGNAESPDLPIQSLEEVERAHILAVLRKTNWIIQGISGAAALLDKNPSTLRGRMRKLGIHRPPYRA